jgi:hypothetical protein
MSATGIKYTNSNKKSLIVEDILFRSGGFSMMIQAEIMAYTANCTPSFP